MAMIEAEDAARLMLLLTNRQRAGLILLKLRVSTVRLVLQDIERQMQFVNNQSIRQDEAVREVFRIEDRNRSDQQGYQRIREGLYGEYHLIENGHARSIEARHLIGATSDQMTEINRLLPAAESLQELCLAKLTAAARIRGIIGPGGTLADDAFRELHITVHDKTSAQTQALAVPALAHLGEKRVVKIEAENLHADGPRDGDKLQWKGKTITVPKGTIYKLILFMWNRDVGAYSDLEEQAFTGPVEPKTVRDATSRTNRCLEKAGVPWRLKPDSGDRLLRKNAPKPKKKLQIRES